MSLSLTTHRKQQAFSAKWSTQQHLAHNLNTDVTATSTNLFRRRNHQYICFNQPLLKQKSFADNLNINKNILTNHTGRKYLSRGLSVGRSHDIQRSTISQQVLRKHSSFTTKSCEVKNESDSSKPGDLITKNITARTQNDSSKSKISRNPRRIQTWSSSSSILKSLDKELAHFNGVEEKFSDANESKERNDLVHNVKDKTITDSKPTSGSGNSQQNQKHMKPEVSKVNLNIVLSHPLVSSKEDNDISISDQEADEDSDDASSTIKNVRRSLAKTKYDTKSEHSTNLWENCSSTHSSIPAQQRRSLYHTSRLATNNNNSAALNSGVYNTQNFNASPSLTVQQRPPLVRAMSAPVRSFHETSKSSTFLNTKRKSRRRKLNKPNTSFDKGSCDLLTTRNFNFDSKSITNRKVLTRSKSVAPDVVTLVSLISSEGSDSERDENNLTTIKSHSGSPNRRAPSLRKSGKSVSFQESYPPTFQFSSKEYSHMLRRGSIVSQTQRFISQRPPTAPTGSIYPTIQNLSNEMPSTNDESKGEDKESNIKELDKKTMSEKLTDTTYDFPEYVRSLKERECWKLFQKMSTKGVNITYDTILRGMLTPTEFRQLQKQREFEEAKAFKEAADNSFFEETSKSSTAIDRLKESLLKN